MAEDLLAQLNPEQKEAVTHSEGPLLIVAGAGTGKTNVITKRIAWLIAEKKAKPDEILAMTFTEKAAGEMEERVDKLLPYGYVDLWISTFHSFCQRILEQHALDIGLPNNFKLLNETGQWLLTYNNFDQFNLDYYRPLGNPTKFIHALLKHFSRAKDEAIFPDEYSEYVKEVELNSDSGGFISQILSPQEQEKLSAKELKELTTQELKKLREVTDAYHTYQQLLFKNNALDFGDLIIYCLRLFQQRPKLLAQYRAKFKYILVDEFQDTNWAQYELIKLLAEPVRNLTVCADDDQSVFKFRGASVSNILQFKNDYPTAREIFLVKNYRSCQNILDLAYRFIQLNNPERLEVKLAGPGSPPTGDHPKGDKLSKRLVAQSDGQAPVELLALETQEEEMKAVVKKIIELKNKDQETTWSDFAILVRANSHADLFNYGLAQANIPYQFVASRGLYSKPIVLDILAYLKLLDNYHESPALYRVLSLPIFKFLQRDLINLNYWSKRKARSLYQTLMQVETLPEISAPVVSEVKKVLGLIEKHTQLARDKNVSAAVLAFLEDSGYLKRITQKDNAASQLEVSFLNQFYKKISEFEANSPEKGIKAFLNLMELEIESGEQGTLITDFEAGPEAVKVMTVHSAKGLEFKHVFIVNLVERRFPTTERRDPIELPDKLVKEVVPSGDIHLQEERRLFYVACTRAKQGLYFSAARDYGGSRKKKPSQFLYDIGLANPARDLANSSRIRTRESIANNVKEGARRDEKLVKGQQECHGVPARFSYSQLKAFESCPWQYRFAFLLRIPVTGKAVFSFGKTIHTTLYKFFEQLMLKQQRDQTDLFGLTKNQSLANKSVSELIAFSELLKFYQESWLDDWYLDAQQKNNYFKKGKEILKNYYNKAKGQSLNPLYLERGFNAKIVDPENSRQYTLFGVIDRIDKNNGGLEIIDYKTGLAKKKLEIDDKEQLLIYQLAASQVFDQEVKNLTFEYLEGGVRHSFLGSDEDLKKIQGKVISVIKIIERGEFLPKPGMLCKFCDFRAICEYRAL